MKYLILLTPLLMAFTICEKSEHEFVSQKIVEAVAEKKGWCDRPIPKPKKSEIVIYYTRDESGNCTIPNAIQGE